MDSKNLITYLTVMCFFKEAFNEKLIDEKEFTEIEQKAAIKCSIPDKSVYRMLVSTLK